MRRLLILKHWQLFGILIGFPVILQFVAMVLILTGRDPIMYFIGFAVMMIFCVSLYFGWFYALGTNLHKRLPDKAKMNLTRFKIFLLIPVVYMLLICVFLFITVSGFSSGGQPGPLIISVILPLHLFSIFCIFYCLYFNAKALKTVEWQKPVKFGDFAGEFFLIWFFPIGIWIIQPRINNLFDPTLATDNSQILDHNV